MCHCALECAEAWQTTAAEAGVDIVDVTTAVGLVLAVKDPEELKLMRLAATGSNNVSAAAK